MRILFTAMVSLVFPFFASSQEYSKLTVKSGVDTVGDNMVTIIPENGASVNKWCDAGMYWIGNRGNKSSYSFRFEKPVSSVVIDMYAINPREEIEIVVNGKKIIVDESMLSPLKTTCGKGKAITRFGNIASNGTGEKIDFTSANTTIKISDAGLIRSIKLNHLNGEDNGVVFDLKFSYDNSSTSIMDINGDDVLFSLSPNPAKDNIVLSFVSNNEGMASVIITNNVGQVVLTKTIPCKASNRESVDLDLRSLAAGNYFAELKMSDTKYTRKFVKL